MLRWRQTAGGIPAADSELRVNVTADGRVLSVLDSVEDLDPATTTPALDAGEAVRAVQDDLGAFRSLARAKGPAGATRATTYADGSSASLALLRGQLTWRVLYRESSTAVWDMFVDAASGKVVKRANLVKSAADALVWDNHPGTVPGGAAAVVDLEARAISRRAPPVCRARSCGRSWTSTTTTWRPPPRRSPPRRYAFAPVLGGGCTDAKPCSWTGSGATWQANQQQNAIQAFYLANRFRDHLAEPRDRLRRVRRPPTRVVVQTDDGASTGPDDDHINNANMFTLPDGQSPIMQMYLWSSTALPRGQRRRRRVDPLPRVHPRALEPARPRRDRAGRAQLAAGRRDGRRLERLVRQGLPRQAVPGPRHGDRRRRAHGHVHRRDGEHDPQQGLDCPVGASAAVCPGTLTGGPGGTRTATSARSRASRRSTTTARSGPRRCGTCGNAPRSAPRPPSG